MNLNNVTYQNFKNLCQKTLDTLGADQSHLPFLAGIYWSDISKRDPKDPDQPTGNVITTSEPSKENPEHTAFSAEYDINKCENLLDFGSGTGTCKDENGNSFLMTLCKNYYNLDADPKANCNFKRIEDIPDNLKFDAIVAHHCLEHVDRDSIQILMKDLCSKLDRHGIIMIIVPNIFNWTSYSFNLDHVLPLTVESIGAFLYMNNVEPFKAYLACKSHDEYLRIIGHSNDPDIAKMMESLNNIYGIHPASQLIVAGIKR
jgi:SAM-dependent methyltransferase